MKKFFALFAALVLSATFAFAVEPTANSVGPWNPDNNVTNGYTETNDYSFDYATGEYKIFVICEIDITNVTGNIYLGWLNPDGAKDLGTAYNMDFKVKGGNGWPFEASARFGSTGSNGTVAYANYEGATDVATDNVFITGSTWAYTPVGGSPTTINSQEFAANHFVLSGNMGQFVDGTNPQLGDRYGEGHGVTPATTPQWANNAAIKSLWSKCNPCANVSNACQGEGVFTLTPGTVWASPDAIEGFYTFPVYVEVDYLTFKDAANYYYTGTPVHTDPSSFTLTTNP